MSGEEELKQVAGAAEKVASIGFSGWLELIKAALAFPDALLRVARFFQSTPQADHEELIKRIGKEADSFSKTGRPG